MNWADLPGGIESFHQILTNAIGFFDELLGLRLNDPPALSA